MDTRAYLPPFLAEAREHLQDLGLALVRIEEAPRDRAAAEGVFRVAHTLKGMSATMGFSAIAALTHAMEDVFELLRQRTNGMPPASIDVLSACLDALEAAVESIAEDGEERLDPAPLVARLQRLVRERTPEQELSRAGDAALPDLTRVGGGLSDGERLVHVAAELADDCTMPSVRAYMLFEALRTHGELVGGVPAPDGVERFAGRRVEAWLTTAAGDEELAESIRAIGELARVDVREAPRPGDGAAATGVSPFGDRKRTPAGDVTRATVRVDAGVLDELLHLATELVQQRTTIAALAGDDASPGLAQSVKQLTRTSQALEATVTRARMVAVETVFLRFPRLVRDLAARLGKQVELRMEGAETELDRSVVDALGDPLVHLVRNALDHGLEPPEERIAAGKEPTGVLELSARHAGGHVIVSVRDDGRGIDPAVVARAAFARGLIDADAAASLDPLRAAELLFESGFSTAETTTDLSGRGVGMDVVRADVRALGGEVTLSSEPGVGALAQLRLPLTLASITALLTTVDGLAFAFPLDRVVRTVRLADHVVKTVRGAEVLTLGEELLPLLDGGTALGSAAHAHAPRGFAVVATTGSRRTALAVDTLAGQRELVTRRLPREVSACAAAAGGAVLPDGSIALLVDCDAL